MKKSHIVIISVALIIISAVSIFTIVSSGGKTKKSGESETLEIEDMTGRTVEIPEKVNRVVGIEAGALRLISYLDATEKVVGVEQWEKKEGKKNPYNMAQPELRDIKSIGPMHGGNQELIASQNPDLVICTYRTAGEAKDLQKKLEIPVVVLKYGGLGERRDTFFEALSLTGKILDKKNRAEELIGYIEEQIATLRNRTEDVLPNEKPSVYVGGIGHRGKHGMESTEPHYEPLQFLNAKNVADNIDREHAMINTEKILEWNPDVLFVDEGGINLCMKDLRSDEYQSLSAVVNDNVYGLLPYNFYTANMGTILANSYYMGKVLYPERFEDIDSENKADEIYREFVGKGVYENVAKLFGGFKRIEVEG